ncbi:hypothetical protein NDU88_007141 [Pleurodeles waltl]|uniref:Uncharacterized protein n=1 Tax=Pleurodeles waltl TaxID=8319 RepID=A0AAV7VRM8_PLEWA|nr:hypothetical protein NDU88_007141 [Pleurodeles waltl]
MRVPPHGGSQVAPDEQQETGRSAATTELSHKDGQERAPQRPHHTSGEAFTAPLCISIARASSNPLMTTRPAGRSGRTQAPVLLTKHMLGFPLYRHSSQGCVSVHTSAAIAYQQGPPATARAGANQCSGWAGDHRSSCCLSFVAPRCLFINSGRRKTARTRGEQLPALPAKFAGCAGPIAAVWAKLCQSPAPLPAGHDALQAATTVLSSSPTASESSSRHPDQPDGAPAHRAGSHRQHAQDEPGYHITQCGAQQNVPAPAAI